MRLLKLFQIIILKDLVKDLSLSKEKNGYMQNKSTKANCYYLLIVSIILYLLFKNLQL